MEKKEVLSGFGIVIADRGFVYVGNIESGKQFCVIENAQNIRKWGTSRGLGQLALEGPQSETVLDKCGTVRIPSRAVISILDSDESKWSRSK